MRPSKDEWALQLALVTAQRATCLRRRVGAVLLNKRGHVLSTGYNGVAAGQKHCNEEVGYRETFDSRLHPLQQRKRVKIERPFPYACSGATSPSGTNLDGCEAIHAEQNALLQCRDVHEIHTVAVTASPCITCVKLLLNTTCERVIFLAEYPHTAARELWLRAGRSWEHVKIRPLPELNEESPGT